MSTAARTPPLSTIGGRPIRSVSVMCFFFFFFFRRGAGPPSGAGTAGTGSAGTGVAAGVAPEKL